ATTSRRCLPVGRIMTIEPKLTKKRFPFLLSLTGLVFLPVALRMALRRRLLPALTVGLILAAIAGTATWFLMPPPEITARTKLHISLEPPNLRIPLCFPKTAELLIALALRHIDAGLRHKVDPEDVVQSVYKRFFFRYGAGNLDVVNWNSLWGLLSLIAVRKCAERAAYHRAECRDAARELSPPQGEKAAPWLEPFGREPTPLEAAVLSETVEQLFAGLDEEERPILELSLQGYTTREISERLGRAERTVRLLREGVRHRLERMQREGL